MEKQNYFTVDEANQKIPWLETQLREIASLSKDIDSYRLDLDNILRMRSGNGHGDTDQDVVDSRRETDAAIEKSREIVQEINDSGIILRDAARGLADFPALWGRREVYLCWVLGESRIQFWHEIYTGFSGRQPLV